MNKRDLNRMHFEANLKEYQDFAIEKANSNASDTPIPQKVKEGLIMQAMNRQTFLTQDEEEVELIVRQLRQCF